MKEDERTDSKYISLGRITRTCLTLAHIRLPSHVPLPLWLESFRVPWKQRCPPNVVQLQEQHQHSLQADATAAVRGTSHPEPVEVALHRLGLNAFRPHLLRQESGVVNTLCAGQNLLAAHEKVVRV